MINSVTPLPTIHFSTMINSLKEADPKELKKRLDQLTILSIEGKEPGWFDSFLRAISREQLESIIKAKEQEWIEVDQLATQLLEIFSDSNFFKDKHFLEKDLEKASSVYRSFFPNLVNTFLKAFTFFDTGKEPESIWEANYLLDTYYKLFSIPFILAISLSHFVSAMQAVLLSGMATTVALGTLYSYLKWLKPCPQQLPSCINLTQKAKRGEIKPLVGRCAEIDRMNAAITGNMKQHVLLYGDTGVGKTTQVYELARRLVDKGIQLQYINAGELVDTCGWVGFSGKLKQIFMKIRGYEDQVVFFIDEIHLAMKNAALPGFLNTVLDSSKLQFIAATTYNGYKEISKDPAFQRRFPEKIELKSVDRATLKGILLQIAKDQKEQVPIDIEAIDRLIELTSDLKISKSQPARAIDVLKHAINEAIHNMRAKHSPIKQEQQLKNTNDAMFLSMSFDHIKQKRTLEKEIKDHKRSEEEVLDSIRIFNKLWRRQNNWTRELVISAKKFKENKSPLDAKKILYYYNAIPELMKKIASVESKIPKGTPVRVNVSLIEKAVKQIYT